MNKYRNMHGARGELEHCSQEDVMQIAKDLGVSVSDLRGLAAKGPRAADTLQKMLLALCVDPQDVAKADPAVMRDLQRLCMVCGQKAVVSTNWPGALPPTTFVSSVPTHTYWMRCSNRKCSLPSIDAPMWLGQRRLLAA
jgi:hypothetical protein